MIPTSDKREAAFADDLSVHPTKLSIRIAPYNRWATSAVRPGFYLIRDLNAAKGSFSAFSTRLQSAHQRLVCGLHIHSRR